MKALSIGINSSDSLKNLNKVDESGARANYGDRIPAAFQDHINRIERIGKYINDKHQIIIFIVHLKKEPSIERARAMQRNFIAWYLKRGTDQKDAALVAFVSPDPSDWRFSLVKMDYKFDEKGKVEEEVTPARRWSFLVGTNEKSHTAQSRLAPLIERDEKDPSLADLEDAFNIEKVTKEFFTEYRKLFIEIKEALDVQVTTDRKIRGDFEKHGVNTVDFAKKLLGQIVFLYFLQKKGWFGVQREAAWGTGSKNFLRELYDKKHGSYINFFNDILEPLFYDALSRDRSDINHWNDHFKCRIPFLNGGLFDPISNYNWVETDILLPNELFSNNRKNKAGDKGDGILDVFDRYNFTVREDEPLEKEVAIDPELLGKAYEKFNSIRPDNFEDYKKALKSGNKGEESKFNRQFGVYYTPREIVHYMCKQSLINYLSTELEGKINKEENEIFINYSEHVEEHEAQVESTGRETDTYKSKIPESVRNNAVEIDRKLFEIKVCDPAVGSGAFPVGMMSEIVKVRKALNIYIKDNKRTVYHFKRECIEKSLYGVDIDPGAVEIAKLRLWLSLVVDEDDIRQIKPLPNLDYKIVCGNSLLGYPYTPKGLDKIEELKVKYFNETRPQEKIKLKGQIDKTLSDLFSNTKKAVGYEVTMDLKINFSEVFRAKGGFDVIIANPPYIQIKQISCSDRKVFQNIFRSAVGRFNVFYFFIEFSKSVTKSTGVSSFIVPDRLLLNTQCVELRKRLLKEQSIVEITSFEEGVFEAIVDSIIIIFNNSINTQDFITVKNRVTIDSLYQDEAIKIPLSFFLNSASNQFDLAYKPSTARLLEKIYANSISLGEIGDIKDGIIQGKVADKLFLDNKIDQYSKPLLFGSDVTRYFIQFSDKWVNYEISKMMRLEVKRRGKDVRPGLWMRSHEIFERPKILTRQTADNIIAAYDIHNFYYANTLHGTTITDSQYNPYYVLSVLNSKLITWYYRTTTAEEGKVFAQIKIALLRMLPIYKASTDQQKPFISIVDKILNSTKSKDYLKNSNIQTKINEYEKEIDLLVYKLYGLTYDEVKIVDPEFELSKAEYERKG